MVYRQGWLKEAGYDSVPGDFPGFLELCKALQQSGHPAGFALGHAVGDAGWTDWVLWGFGAAMIDETENVIINIPKTIEALDYAKALYDTFIPGTLSWLDPSNNKAFLAGELGLTSNGISIYYACKTARTRRPRRSPTTSSTRLPDRPGRFPEPGRARDQRDRVRPTRLTRTPPASTCAS